MEEKATNQLTCLHCGYTWTLIRPNPGRCPKCKNFNWDKPKRAPRRTLKIKKATTRLKVCKIPTQIENNKKEGVNHDKLST